MTTATNKYALIEENENLVTNIIIATEGFSYPGQVLIKINEGVCCEPGSFYNSSDKLFYIDKGFSSLTGIDSSHQDESS